MEQRVLCLEVDGKKIVSKPWDFEAMCIVDDARGKARGDLSLTKDAVAYLFEGTEATASVLNTVPPAEIATFCKKVCAWYISDMDLAAKNAQSPQKKAGKRT